MYYNYLIYSFYCYLSSFQTLTPPKDNKVISFLFLFLKRSCSFITHVVLLGEKKNLYIIYYFLSMKIMTKVYNNNNNNNNNNK
ncbi:hypothetical protein RFI_21845 [Reticulomyxa filosa]|uniref:Uncharacterized protein n=1 Tax=Reticulomyxa filosa TaxID=46433 RepID=X6MNE4_RETFI|nr:hypothetical protein RFI_21845 [Reticulomyxa filosa]|eukprot:ETO15518.1 hypothetical protein RFI_21845 [Reticulomyxa filosa]